MTLTNKLKKQVDLPVWEWCRLAPGTSSAVSSTCAADNSLYHVTFGRYIYYMQAAATLASTTGLTGFFRYDTVSDTYQMLAQPPVTVAVLSAMTFAGGRGYNGRVLSAGPNTLTAAALTGQTLKGFDIRISEGTGDGQQRIITNVSDPVIAYSGTVTTAATSPQSTIIDANANWAINQWVGYQVRFMHASGQSQVRKIMYNTTNTLYFGDIAKMAEDQQAWAPIVTITGSTLVFSALGAAYQIESSEITVDSPWLVQPDETSRFVVRSGGIWLISSGTTPVAYTLQYYDIAADTWYIRNGAPITSQITSVPTDATTQCTGENACVWDRGVALGTHTKSSLQDTTKDWIINQWAGYELRFFSGTGEGKILHILSNTADTVTFSPVACVDPATVTADAGAINTYTVTTTTNTPVNCNGWSILGSGIGAGATIVSGQGTKSLLLSVANSGAVSGTLSLGMSATGVNGEYTITTSIPTPQTCNGWKISGTGIAAGSFIVSGQGTTNLVLSVANSDTVSGLITMDLSVTAASGNAGEYIITTTTATPKDCNGWQISGTGIAIGATIISGQGTTSLVLSLPNTASVTGNVLDLDLVPDNTSKYFIDAFEVGIVTEINPPVPKNASTITASSGVISTPNITLSSSAPSNCDGWYISGVGIPADTTVLSGQGSKKLVLSANNTATVSGILIVSPTRVSATAASGVINTFAITTSVAVPANCNGWYISGTGIGAGATIVSGQNTTSLVLSMPNTSTVSGTLYLYPTVPTPNIAQLSATTGSGGSTTVTTTVAAPLNCNGWYISGTGIGVGAMILSGQGTTSLTLSVANSGTVSGTPTIATAFTTATASSGALGTYTITTSVAVPANCNGWYISGTGIGAGATIVSGQGTTTLSLSMANTATVSGTLTISATAVSTGSINGGVFTAGTSTGSYYPGQILLGGGVQSPLTINTPVGACYTTGLSATINFAIGNPAAMGIVPGMAVTFLSGTTGAQSSFPAGVSVSSVTSNTVVLTAAVVTAALSYATLQFGPVFYSSISATTSAGTLITVATTAYLSPGMFVSVTTGTGTFTLGTYITQINSATTFTVSQSPTAALVSGAVIAFQPYQVMITKQLSGIPGGAGTYSVYPSTGTFATAASVPIIGFGNSVFRDNTKNWSLNRWNNQVVRIKSGAAAGSARSILGTVAGLPTYTSASTSASSNGNVVTLSSGNTTGLSVGMVLNVTAGTGAFMYGTSIKAINSSTQFTLTDIPVTPLSGATITASPVNTLITYPAWTSIPDSTSRYVIHGDQDKIYESFATITPTIVHNIESDIITQGRMLDYGVARGTSAQFSDYPALALSLTTPSVPVLPITSAVGYVPSSVVSAGSVSGGITTITHAGGIFPIGSWIIVAGVTPTTYNGTWQVTNSSVGSVSYYNASGSYSSGGTVLQTNSINLGGSLNSGAYSAWGNGTTFTISGCVPTAYNGTFTVAAGLAATPTRSMAGYQSAPGATNSTTTITVGDTTGLVAGMIPVVTAGTGAFPTGTVITSITNGTQFVVSQTPSPSLASGAVISVTPSVAWVGTIPGNLTNAGVVQKVPQAVTVATRSGATCTLTTSLSLFQVGSWIHVTGITPAGYNGVYQVTASSAGSVTYVAAADPGASGSVFGTVGLATTTQLVTTINNHNFKTGQYILHQGDTGFSAVNNNISAPITTLPTTNLQYTYPVAFPSAPMLNYVHTTTQLCDATKNWLPNQWAGCMVTYNSTQITNAIPPVQPTILAAHVIANTNNTLIFAAAHTLPVGGVSRYVITAPASSLMQNSLGSADSGVALGAQTAALLQDVTKSWVSPGGTVGILGTAITTATATVTIPLINVANLYTGMTGLIMYSASGTTLAASSTISSIAIATGVVTMSGNFTTSGTATMLFGYGVATATSGAGTATVTTSAGLYVGMLAAVSSGSVTLAAGTTITAISANGLTITLSNPFGGTTSAAVLTFTAPCSSSGNTITVSGYTTAGLAVGMYVGVLSAANLSVPTSTAGAFVANGGTNLTTVKVTSIINATQFTVSATPAVPLVNATVIASYWLPGMWYNRRIRITSGSGANFLEAACTGNNHNTLFVAITTPVHGSTGYSILQQPNRGLGTNLIWNFGQSDLSKRGAYIVQARGGNLTGFDRLDLRIDKWEFLTPTPNYEGLTTGAMYAYDGGDRIYFTPQLTQRVYYLDVDTMTIHGGSQYPYLAGGTAIIGNRMEIFETADGLRYLWLNRHSAQECFRQLLFY